MSSKKEKRREHERDTDRQGYGERKREREKERERERQREIDRERARVLPDKPLGEAHRVGEHALAARVCVVSNKADESHHHGETIKRNLAETILCGLPFRPRRKESKQSALSLSLPSRLLIPASLSIYIYTLKYRCVCKNMYRYDSFLRSCFLPFLLYLRVCSSPYLGPRAPTSWSLRDGHHHLGDTVAHLAGNFPCLCELVIQNLCKAAFGFLHLSHPSL